MSMAESQLSAEDNATVILSQYLSHMCRTAVFKKNYWVELFKFLKLRSCLKSYFSTFGVIS